MRTTYAFFLFLVVCSCRLEDGTGNLCLEMAESLETHMVCENDETLLRFEIKGSSTLLTLPAGAYTIRGFGSRRDVYRTDSLSRIALSPDCYSLPINGEAFSFEERIELLSGEERHLHLTPEPITGLFRLYANDLVVMLDSIGRSSLEIEVQLTFRGYFPVGYNLYTDRINRFEENLVFRGKRVLQRGDSLLTFGHILSGENETYYHATLLLRSEAWSSPKVYVLSLPVSRGKLFRVEGAFLSKEGSASGLIHDYLGEIDIIY